MSTESTDTRRADLRLRFPERDVHADAVLIPDRAPLTCAAVMGSLPLEGEARHGIYSGPEALVFLPATIAAPAENATSEVEPGDVAFYRFRGGTELVEEDRECSEVAWFYAPGAVPSMRDGAVAVNVFARLVGDWRAFAEISRQLGAREATERIRLEPTPRPRQRVRSARNSRTRAAKAAGCSTGG